MRRPTIRDLSEAAGVSVATVNRVLGGAGNVRKPTMERVLHAAESIGFYGTSSIRSRMESAGEKHRFGILLLQRNRTFYQMIANSLREAAETSLDCDIELRIEHVEDLSPDHVAEKLIRMGEDCDCIAVVAAQHPIIAGAIERLHQNGIPVIALVSPLNANCNVGYVGLDNWKVGRTSAWTFHRLCRAPGKIGTLVGNHRYRCQELNESGFRSYFREFGGGFELLEPNSTFESSAIARELTERLLSDHRDLSGLYISGGGITGALAALRESGRREDIVTVGYEIMDETKKALMDHTLDLVISHPLQRLGQEAIASLIRAKAAGTEGGSQRSNLQFEIYTSENV